MTSFIKCLVLLQSTHIKQETLQCVTSEQFSVREMDLDDLRAVSDDDRVIAVLPVDMGAECKAAISVTAQMLSLFVSLVTWNFTPVASSLIHPTLHLTPL